MPARDGKVAHWRLTIMSWQSLQKQQQRQTLSSSLLIIPSIWPSRWSPSCAPSAGSKLNFRARWRQKSSLALTQRARSNFLLAPPNYSTAVHRGVAIFTATELALVVVVVAVVKDLIRSRRPV